jgi:hypothetical protein
MELPSIVNNLPSKNIYDQQSLMEMENYLGKLIDHFCHITHLVNEYNCNQVKFSWGVMQWQVFEKITHQAVLAPILVFPGIQQVFKIEVDASRHAMGTVLMQHKRPIADHFKTLSGADLNYSIHDNEMHALVKVIKHQ